MTTIEKLLENYPVLLNIEMFLPEKDRSKKSEAYVEIYDLDKKLEIARAPIDQAVEKALLLATAKGDANIRNSATASNMLTELENVRDDEDINVTYQIESPNPKIGAVTFAKKNDPKSNYVLASSGRLETFLAPYDASEKTNMTASVLINFSRGLGWGRL